MKYSEIEDGVSCYALSPNAYFQSKTEDLHFKFIENNRNEINKSTKFSTILRKRQSHVENFNHPRFALRFIYQLMRIGFLFTFFILLSLQVLHASNVKGQDMLDGKVHLKLQNESLVMAIKQIEEQTSLHFYYRKADVDQLGKLQLSVQQKSVKDILTALLGTSGFTFRQINNTILIEKGSVQESYTVKGRLIGTDHKPLEMATVSVTKAGNPKILQTTLADTAGKFSLTVYSKGDFIIKVSSIGTDSVSVPFSVNELKTVELPDIVVNSSSRQLQTVTIAGKRPLLRQEADRIIYDLQADPQSKVSSVLDMMRRVPYLSVDGDDNVLLKGSSGYKVLINGRPSGLVERNLKDVLRSIPASTIKNIEVITNPPAKYDAEGLVGIINIITIKQVDNGYQGSVNINDRGPVGGPGAGFSFATKQGKLGLTLMGGGNINNTPQTKGLLTRSTFSSDPTSLEQNAFRKSNNKTGYTGLEVSYELDSLNLLVAQFNINHSIYDGYGVQQSALNDLSGLLQAYRLQNNNTAKSTGFDASLNYQLNFRKNRGRALTFSYRYLHNRNNNNAGLAISDTVNFDEPSYRQYNDEALREQTVQVDYIHPLKKLTIEGGLKGIFRNNNSNFLFESLNAATGIYEPDQLRSDYYNNNQNVLSAYNSYDYRSGHWQLKAGVRAEQTLINGDFTTGTTKVNQKYLNVLPSVVLNRKFGEGSSLSISYANRIQRPAIAQLNPFVDRSNPNFQTTGNPDLRPITSSLTQLSYLYSGKGTYNIAVGYMSFNRTINPIYFYDAKNDITISRYENQGKGHVVKMNIYVNYPLTKRWSATLNADLRRVFYYSFVQDSVLKNFGSMAYANISSSYRFDKGWRANAEFTMNTGGVSSPQGRSNGFIATSLGMSKDFLDNKLTLSAAINNPFTKFRYVNNTVTGLDFTQYTSDQSYYRRYSFSINYRFGKLKSEIKKNKKSINNDDIVK